MTPLHPTDIIAQLPDTALLLEPREVFDRALVGVTDTPSDHWPRRPGVVVAVYDVELCVVLIAWWLGCDHEAALDYFGYNTSGAWVGDGTPAFHDRSLEADEEG